jgi:predicted Zn-dependent peptidase
MKRSRTSWLPLIPAIAIAACARALAPTAQPSTPVAKAPAEPDAAASANDVLGPRPSIDSPSTFVPPVPVVFTISTAMNAWLLERHEVPLVSCAIAIPTGASSDPVGKAGLAHVTAEMLDEGAGRLGSVEFARAVDDLGARFTTEANADASIVSMTVVKRHLDRAFSLFGDAVTVPRLDPKEFKRIKELWINELIERARDPDATARVVARVALFGPSNPYGHPWDGTLPSARGITIEDVRRFYASAWHPERATLVCSGDITVSELKDLVNRDLGSWKHATSPLPPVVAPMAPSGPWPKVVAVDRPDAPQSVIAVVAPGIAASEIDVAKLWRTNDAIGGSFMSRLNQDLREDHGYTYGARSRYSLSRGVGQVISSASVVTDKTGDALVAMVGDLKAFAQGGLTDIEVGRTRFQARGELVHYYESVESISRRLVTAASLGLAADSDAARSEACDKATRADLDRLARRFYDPKDGMIVVVGPTAKVTPMLIAAGFPAPEIRDAEGTVIATASGARSSP